MTLRHIYMLDLNVFIILPSFYLIDLPKLVEQPKITNNKCGNLTLSWNGWVEDVDIGKGPIAQYL